VILTETHRANWDVKWDATALLKISYSSPPGYYITYTQILNATSKKVSVGKNSV